MSLGIVFVSLAVPGFFGGRIYREKSPVPDKVVTQEGKTLFSKKDTQNGQLEVF